MSHPPLTAGMMAPDSHAAMHDTTTTTTTPSTSPSQDTPTSTDPSALLTLMAIGPTPTPPPNFLPLLSGGILSKGGKLKKRVSFRDHNLVSIREIPPRPRRTSSSEEDGDEDEESDEGEDSGTSDSEDDSDDSDSEEEEVVVGRRKGVRKPPGVVTGKAMASSARPAPKTRSSSSSLSSANSSLSSPRGARADRSHTSAAAANASSAPSAKGSYQVTSSSTSRVVSLVSQITGVSSAATQTHIKQRKAAATASKNTSSSSPKQVTAVLRVEKKVKKVSPNLDGVSSPQLVRVGQSKDGAPTVSKGGQGKGAKKKRVSPQSQRKQDTAEKKKAITLRKTKETKTNAKGCGGGGDGVNGTNTDRVKLTVVVNGFSTVRDSLSLPPLGAGQDHPTPPSKPLLKHTAIPNKTPIFSVDRFIFPGDLATGVKVKVNGKVEETKDVPPKAVRDRLSCAPPGSPGRRKRCHAWYMANGGLQNSLQEPPSITPMFETVTLVGGATPATSPLPPHR